MEEYESPSAELIGFENPNSIVAVSGGCNCFADRWNEGHAIDSGCTGISYDFEELLWSSWLTIV